MQSENKGTQQPKNVVTDNDLKLLNLVKKHRHTLYDVYARVNGYSDWFDEYSKSNAFENHRDFFLAADYHKD